MIRAAGAALVGTTLTLAAVGGGAARAQVPAATPTQPSEASPPLNVPADAPPGDDGVVRDVQAPPSPTEMPPSASPALLPPDEAALTAVPENPGDKRGRGKKRKNGQDDIVPPEHVASDWGGFSIKGRIFVRAALQRRDEQVFEQGLFVPSTRESLDLSVPSARASLRYRAPVEWLTAELEIDISGKPDMKDGYINARGRHLSARLGQFKVPGSAFELESPWVLPLLRRGLISDIIVDRLDVAGRRPGVMVGWRARGLLKPRLALGAFQGAVVTEEGQGYREMDLLEDQSLRSQTLAARGQIEVAGIQVGAYYQHRVGSPAPFRTGRFWTAGADVLIDWTFAHGGFRLWLDGVAGASWYEKLGKPADDQDATFVAGRLLVGYRLGGTTAEAPYVEFFALGGGLDPDVDFQSDLAWETVVGVNVGLWNRARLSLQGEKEAAMRNFPESYFLGRDPDRIALLMQAGLTF